MSINGTRIQKVKMQFTISTTNARLWRCTVKNNKLKTNAHVHWSRYTSFPAHISLKCTNSWLISMHEPMENHENIYICAWAVYHVSWAGYPKVLKMFVIVDIYPDCAPYATISSNDYFSQVEPQHIVCHNRAQLLCS